MTVCCNAVGCTTPRKPSMFMCLRHWHALPRPLRDQVNATWAAYRLAADRQEAWISYIEARDEAIRWTAEGEGQIANFEPDAPRLKRLRGERDEPLLDAPA